MQCNLCRIACCSIYLLQPTQNECRIICDIFCSNYSFSFEVDAASPTCSYLQSIWRSSVACSPELLKSAIKAHGGAPVVFIELLQNHINYSILQSHNVVICSISVEAFS